MVAYFSTLMVLDHFECKNTHAQKIESIFGQNFTDFGD